MNAEESDTYILGDVDAFVKALEQGVFARYYDMQQRKAVEIIDKYRLEREQLPQLDALED